MGTKTSTKNQVKIVVNPVKAKHKLDVKVDPKALAQATTDITKVGHAVRYVKTYPLIAAALSKIPQGLGYDEDKTARENCTRLAIAVINQGLDFKPGTMRDMLRCYFRDTRNTGTVISHLVSKDTREESKKFLAYSLHSHLRVKKATETEEATQA